MYREYGVGCHSILHIAKPLTLFSGLTMLLVLKMEVHFLEGARPLWNHLPFLSPQDYKTRALAAALLIAFSRSLLKIEDTIKFNEMYRAFKYGVLTWRSSASRKTSVASESDGLKLGHGATSGQISGLRCSNGKIGRKSPPHSDHKFLRGIRLIS